MNHPSAHGNKGESVRAYRKGWASLHSTRKHEEEDVSLYSRVVRKILIKIADNLCRDHPKDCI